MIISIDESGDFNAEENKENLFLAAHLFNSEQNIKTKKIQFENWENSITNSIKDKNGEVKGQRLSEKEIINFFEQVILSGPEIKFTIVYTNPTQISKKLIEKHKSFEIKCLEHISEISTIKGLPKKIVNFQKQMLSWLNKRPLDKYLKLYSLKVLLTKSLDETITYGIGSGNEDELMSISFKIDKDFLTKENIYWKEYKKQSIIQLSNYFPVFIPIEWGKNHPFVNQYVTENHKLNSTIFFEDNLDFYDSKSSFEVRIADISALAAYRVENSKNTSDYLKKLLYHPRITEESRISLNLNDFNFEERIQKFKIEI